MPRNFLIAVLLLTLAGCCACPANEPLPNFLGAMKGLPPPADDPPAASK